MVSSKPDPNDLKQSGPGTGMTVFGYEVIPLLTIATGKIPMAAHNAPYICHVSRMLHVRWLRIVESNAAQA